MNDRRQRLAELVAAHEAWRARTVNLIASENALSPVVRAALGSDLVQRYAGYTGHDLSARRYRGNRYIELMEREATKIAQEAFQAEHVELRPISGHIAGAAVLVGLCDSGDLVLELGRDGGGHREAGKLAAVPLVPLKVEYLPFDQTSYNVDVAATLRLIAERRPRMVILGSSNFLFPHHSGHAFGILQQERPYLIPAESMPLKEGMVVTLEPGIFIPGWGGMRLEGDYVIGATDARRLDHFPSELTECCG